MCFCEVRHDVRHYAFQYFPYCVLKSNRPVCFCLGVIWFAWFSENNSVCVFEACGEVSKVDARLHQCLEVSFDDGECVLNTLFAISSGPGALSGASLLTAS